MRMIVWWVLLAGFWLALVDNHHLDELAVGALTAVAGAGVAAFATSRLDTGARIPPRSWLRLPRVAWLLARDSALLLAALWRAVVLRRDVRGRWRSERIDDGASPAARGRRVFTVLAGSVAPNRVVAETEGGRLHVHELVPSGEPLDPLAGR